MPDSTNDAMTESARSDDRGRLTPDELRTKEMLPTLTRAAGIFGRRAARGTGSHEELEEPGGGQSGTFRAAIFGISDGLGSNVSLIMGVAGAGAANKFILLAGLSGLLAGAFSMGAGEYVSMRAQREVFERLIKLERHELQLFPEQETRELAAIYQEKGVPAELALELATSLSADIEIALDTHAREELGLDPEEGLGSPWGAAIASFFMFAVGAAVPLVPFLVTSGSTALIASAVLSAIVLFIVGAGIAIITGKSMLMSGLRQTAIVAVAAAVTYGVGTLLHVGAVG